MDRHHSNIATLTEALRAQPRTSLATLPTPLVYAPRFSAEIGSEVWLKRDDLTGLALGGNKARKLEFLFGLAQQRDIDTVVSVGAAQSNHARTVAAAARVACWECHLVLGGERPARPSGNLVLDVAFGAHLHFPGTDSWSELESAATELFDELEARGRRPLFIPMGGSTPVGALGFVSAYLELLAQLDEIDVHPEAIVHATSTGGTQAGLDYAHHVVGGGPAVIGVGVAKTDAQLADEVAILRTGLAELLGLSAAIDHARKTQGPVVFWHTGGIPALFSESNGITTWPSDGPQEARR